MPLLIYPSDVEVAPVGGLEVVVGAHGDELFARLALHALLIEEILVRELLDGARDIATGEDVIVQMYLTASAEVLELHLIDIDGNYLKVIVTINGETEVALIGEVA